MDGGGVPWRCPAPLPVRITLLTHEVFGKNVC